jgi:hypothetical protein
MKIFAVLLLVCIFLTGTGFGAEYPVDKGSTLISGGFSFANASGNLYEDSEGNSTKMLSFAPSVLGFVVPNLALGGNVEFAWVSQGDVSMTTLAIGPKIGYFVGQSNSKTYPYFGMGFNFLRNTFEEEEYVGWGRYEKEEYTISGTRFFFGAGLYNMVGSHLAIGFEGIYNLDSLKPEDGKSESGSIFLVIVTLAGFIF